MHWRSIIQNTPVRVKRWLLIAGASLVVFWFVFLDSHSLLSRVRWQREFNRLQSENAELRAQIEDLETRLARPLTDEELERIAREDYGMSRPGEVVYPVEEDK